MASKIKPATQSERKRAETIRDRDDFGKGILKILNYAESGGFRVLYEASDKRVGILMPSNNVLYWDFNPRSLDLLQYPNQRELRDACLYAGLVASSIFSKKR